MQTIWILGDGQLGQTFFDYHQFYPHFNWKFLTKDNLDLTKDIQNTIFQPKKNDICINCMAYTAVDLAEKESDLAMQINYFGVQKLANFCNQKETKLIHFSTDYVFDGTKNQSYIENDTPKPLNIYGLSKFYGEQEVLTFKKNVLFRISWLYSKRGKNFAKTILELLKTKDKLTIISDQIAVPTLADSLVKDLMQILSNPEQQNKLVGIWHYCNNGLASWYDFAYQIKILDKSQTTITPIFSSQYPTLATRPKFSHLSNHKLALTFDLKIPYWTEDLHFWFDNLKN